MNLNAADAPSHSGPGAAPAQRDFLQTITPLAVQWRRVIGYPVAATLLTFGATYLVTPTFTARATFLPPVQSQGGAAAALASLGSLANLAGGSGAVKSSIDQYVSLLLSRSVADRVIEKFNLMEVYKVDLHDKARKALSQHVTIVAGKKDSLITVDVDDESPTRAAAIANDYIEELRRVSAVLALTEAQQRRVFFEKQLQETKVKLVAAQTALQESGFNAGAIKTEPKTAADTYAKLQVQQAAAEIKLQTLRQRLADTSPEVAQQLALLSALREQLTRQESSAGDASASAGSGSADYIGKFREFKYQETLFDVYAKQYELARADESKEGSLVQVVDTAIAPERKSKPQRTIAALIVGFLVGVAYAGHVIFKDRLASDPAMATRFAAFRLALRRKSA